ncbi:uncharacterized protein B0H18DRAFT_981763 [Fomitopsis serialis]|uniref:uncharacterized protein n=1 Tax=Fomitopsis serialis TaxID=139415 RepID=UPI00200869AF|nr:uncharacterized protein B0H18DRAFT_981763 [Neoantrodia serialis]KAH9933725.1 hypothetical protein B0H18DRAFT_981763 [Neoantrodia serialis]
MLGIDAVFAVFAATLTLRIMGEKAHWTDADVSTFLQVLKEHKAEAGDGGNFKAPTFKKASGELEKCRTKGAVKTWTSCRNKYAKLRETYKVVYDLSVQSGFHWDNENGAAIDEDSEAVWQAYVEKHPEAEPFRNKGWPHFEDMKELMPSKVKGTHAFHPATQMSGCSADAGASRDATVDRSTPEPSDDGEANAARHSTPVAEAIEDTEHLELPATPPPPPKRKAPASSSTSTQSSKRMRGPGQAAALNSLHEEFGVFNEMVRTVMAPDMSSQSTPSRKARAFKLAQEEEGLDADEMVSLLDVFRKDASAADLYVQIKDRAVRRKWVDRQLAGTL